MSCRLRAPGSAICQRRTNSSRSGISSMQMQISTPQSSMQPTQLQCRPTPHRPRAVAMRASSSNGNGTAPPPPGPPQTGTAQAAYAEVPGPRNAFVPGQESESRRQLFNRISPVYDELNDRLSLGQHRLWKRMAVKWTRAKPGQRALDVCCGSGDLALLLADAVGPAGSVTGLDFAADMLQDARQRESAAAADQPGLRRAAVEWVQGDALELPFPDASFDAATMGYGLRNVADIPQALRELRRVLVPGGRVAVLDFNNSEQPLIDGLQGLLLENVVVPAAAAYGLADEYKYLRPSIKRFPTGAQQEALAREAGFSRAAHYEIGFGLMGVLVATR